MSEQFEPLPDIRLEKPGYATTEFWLAVATAVTNFVVIFGVDPSLSEGIVLGVGNVVVAAYALFRTVLKRG